MKRKSDNDERLSPALENLEKRRRKRSRSNSSDEKMVELNRSNSNELDASEFDEMWNDDGANADDSLIEMKTEDQKPTYSSLRSFLKRNQTAFNRHPGRKAQGRKAPPPTPDHVLMPPPLMRAKLRKAVNMLNASPRGGSFESGALKGRSISPMTLRAPPPSPQAYNTKVAFLRPSMPPSPILRSPMYHQSSPLHPTMEDCPAKAIYSMTGTSPQFGPRTTTRSPPPLPLQGSASPATFLSQKMNAHHLTQRAVRQSTTAVLQRVVANITVMKAAQDISGDNESDLAVDEDAMDQEE